MFKSFVYLSSFSLAIFVFLSSCTSSPSTISLPQGVKLLEEVTAVEGEVTIPYRKYQLQNGLIVILHQDHSDPLTHIDVTYHVGSSREQLGKSGFAHFFEHMMFQGSKNVADEQHFKVVTQSGGNLNGTTNSDRTNYYQTVPNNQLEKVLWLESDRMGFLLDAITEEKFEVQRETVKNERQQNVDNRPYGRLNETINQMIFDRQHPYSWPTIGYMSDLDRGTLTDLKQFFSRWYGPNNATLTIGGDFDEQQALVWINQYFSDIKRGPEVKSLDKPLISLKGDRYLSMTDNVSLPLVYISFPTVYAMHKDEAPLDVLANILGNGPTSLLYKNLVKSGIAVQAGAGHPCRELSCQMNFFALPNPQQGMSLSKVEQVIRQTLIEFEQRGVVDDDLLKTKVSIETGTIYGLQSVAGKVTSLAAFQTFTGDANYTNQEIARYNKVTKADVMRVYKHYIKGKGAAILSIVPEGVVKTAQTAMLAQPDNFVLADINNPPKAALNNIKIVSNRSSFDRTQLPAAGQNPQIEVPKLWQKTFANGLKVIATNSKETPTISLLLSLEGGPLLDPIEKAGLASLTAALMEEGTTNYLKEELSNELAKLGSNISVGASGRNTYIQLTSLTKHFDATLTLMYDVMFNPAFNQQDFDRIKNQLLQGLEQGNKDAGSLSARAFKQVLFGINNRVGLPDSGTINTVSAIKLEDIKSFYQRYFSPKLANLVVVGDIDKSQLLAKLEVFSHWKGENYTIPDYLEFPKLDENKILFIDLPNASQTVIKYTRRAMPYDAVGDYFKSTLMNYPIGGAFNSRINLNLREDKGYSYGASSSFSGGKTLGSFTANASVKKSHTSDAMLEIIKELALAKDQGLTNEEVAFMRQAISQNEALSFETPSQKNGFLRQLLQFDLPKNYGQKQTDIINSITVTELNNIAKKELAKPMQWIIVGDGQLVKEQLKVLELDVVDYQLAN
mgnify:CR=1 FL=1